MTLLRWLKIVHILSVGTSISSIFKISGSFETRRTLVVCTTHRMRRTLSLELPFPAVIMIFFSPYGWAATFGWRASTATHDIRSQFTSLSNAAVVISISLNCWRRSTRFLDDSARATILLLLSGCNDCSTAMLRNLTTSLMTRGWNALWRRETTASASGSNLLYFFFFSFLNFSFTFPSWSRR